jgi:hypothetical protein
LRDADATLNGAKTAQFTAATLSLHFNKRVALHFRLLEANKHAVGGVSDRDYGTGFHCVGMNGDVLIGVGDASYKSICRQHRNASSRGGTAIVAKAGVRVIELAALFTLLRFGERRAAVVAEICRHVVLGVALVTMDAQRCAACVRRRKALANGRGHVAD